MAYSIGTLGAGAHPYANQNMLAFIRFFAGGFGTVGTITGVRTGDGTLTPIEASPTSVTETWTLTCTAGGPTGTFTVSGSVSGAQASATVGTPYSIAKLSFTINDGATDFIIGDVFTIPVTESVNPVASRWEVLRYDTVSAVRELILKGKGLSGTEEIFIGFRSYQSVGADYYNISAATFIGYVPGNTYITQPGYINSGVPAHNTSISYWLAVNGQRIMLAMKVGTPVYESCYVGKMLPYALPTQFPAPLICAGMLNAEATTRFSDTSHSMPYKGNVVNMRLRNNAGTWLQPQTYPWNVLAATQMNILRDTDNCYSLTPVEVVDSVQGMYGVLDGIYHISGFNNAVENTVTIGGVLHVVIQDVYRTGFNDYYAMRMN